MKCRIKAGKAEKRDARKEEREKLRLQADF
jgi:hypothetical protein